MAFSQRTQPMTITILLWDYRVSSGLHNEDENKPMYNRFRQVWCPGSTCKPITAAVGLESGAIDPMEDYGNVGLSWQKDASWGPIM